MASLLSTANIASCSSCGTASLKDMVDEPPRSLPCADCFRAPSGASGARAPANLHAPHSADICRHAGARGASKVCKSTGTIDLVFLRGRLQRGAGNGPSTKELAFDLQGIDEVSRQFLVGLGIVLFDATGI